LYRVVYYLPEKLTCMKPCVLLTILLCVLSVVLASPYVVFAQKSDIQNEYSKSTNQMLPDDTVGNSTDLLAEMYTRIK
jgi:hypothetical protein